MRGSRRWQLWPLLVLSGFALVIGAGLPVGLVVAQGNPELVGLLVSIASAVFAPMLTGAAAALWRRRLRPVRESPTVAAEAADALAEAGLELWRVEAAERRLSAPGPIPVRWGWTRHPVTGSVEDAVSAAAGPRRFAELPDVRPAAAGAVEAGDVSDLFAVYAGLSSGRIIILGGPGSGKSTAALMILLAALEHRRSVSDPATRATVPVPVLLTTRGWDPSGRDLRTG